MAAFSDGRSTSAADAFTLAATNEEFPGFHYKKDIPPDQLRLYFADSQLEGVLILHACHVQYVSTSCSVNYMMRLYLLCTVFLVGNIFKQSSGLTIGQSPAIYTLLMKHTFAESASFLPGMDKATSGDSKHYNIQKEYTNPSGFSLLMRRCLAEETSLLMRRCLAEEISKKHENSTFRAFRGRSASFAYLAIMALQITLTCGRNPQQ